MDKIPPYDFNVYVSAARKAVVACSSFEVVMILFGSLEDSGFLAKLIYLLLLAASAAVSAHNIALNIDGREEIKKALSSQENEVRGKSAALVLAPPLAGVLVFLCVSGHMFFSLFVLCHVVAAVGQLAIEAYETRDTLSNVVSGQRSASKAPTTDPLASPHIVAPDDRTARAPTFDPNYQTLNNIHNDIFDKKKV